MARSKPAMLIGALLILTVLSLLAWPGAAQASIIEQVSLNSAGAHPVGECGEGAISEDGRYVAFYTMASDVVPGDTNGVGDIFVRDTVSNTSERVSVSSAEVEANGWSGGSFISADGRYVAFGSGATNLAGAGDINGAYDVFVRDRTLGTTVQVSVSTAGVRGDAASHPCAISPNGRYVVFESEATNLVAGDTNGQEDVFVRDLVGGTTTRVSVRSDATQGNAGSYDGSISADGRYVAFESEASTLILGDGTFGFGDIFVRDMTTGAITRASVSTAGVEGNDASENPSISADGRYVSYESDASNLVGGDTNVCRDIFVRDRNTLVTSRVSLTSTGAQADGRSSYATLRADGRAVVFDSDATNLVGGDTNALTDVFLRDLQTGITKRLSMAFDGPQANATCVQPYISNDGLHVTFGSEAYNLTPTDSGGWWNVFMVTLADYKSIRGSDRYDTAIRLSQARFPGALSPGSGLVLAPGETFPEALCGGPLASAYGGPVLLTYRTALANNVRNEMIRLAPKYVICVGLSAGTVSAVITAMGPAVTVTSITGANVYEMSHNVAGALGTKVGDMSGATAIITRGDTFPDAIGVSPLACAYRWPILLTNSVGGVLNTNAANALSELGITQVLKAGTYCTLPLGITGLANLSGGDRYHTNVNVAEWAMTNTGLDLMRMGIATGDKFPDALAAGPYLATNKSLLLLSPLAGPVPDRIKKEIGAHSSWIHHVTFIACIEPVIGQVKALVP